MHKTPNLTKTLNEAAEAVFYAQNELTSAWQATNLSDVRMYEGGKIRRDAQFAIEAAQAKLRKAIRMLAIAGSDIAHQAVKP